MKLTKQSSDFINALRALSSQTVLIGHTLVLTGFISKGSLMYQLPSFAVLVFFVLSGFVIAYSVSQKGVEYGFKNYFIDRFSRIYVTLIPAILLTYLLTYYKPINISWSLFFCNLTMQQDNPLLQEVKYILPSKVKFIGVFGGNLPLWSLSIEWWLYMFFGILFYYKSGKLSNAQKIIFILSLPFVIGFAVLKGRASWGLSYIWFSGVLVNYLIFNSKTILNIGNSKMLFSLLLTIITYYFNTSLSIIPFVLYFYFSVSYYQENDSSSTTKLIFRVLKLPSDISFSVYIIHYPILLLLLHVFSSKILFVLVGYLISNVLSFIIFLCFEKHHKQVALFLKRRF